MSVLGTLNRGAGVLLPFAALLSAVLSKSLEIRTLLITVGSNFIAVATFFVLQVKIGPADRVVTVYDILASNLSLPDLFKLFVNLLIMFGIGWLLAVWGARRSIHSLVWASFSLCFSFILAFGIWLEVRLLLPLS